MRCTVCIQHGLAVGEIRAYVGRLARRAAKSGLPTDIARVRSFRAELDRQRKFQQDHEREHEEMA
ncbi:hypothetical protein [Salinispora pacifica]|uniref:hypothetical protein n=1 Tax=Salinispora pacifica TaxID=351187 RepID=UPI00037BC811|nr:hypothetical protein [Salinispora pacifica]